MLTEHLHAHTWRCHHATGTEREYVEEAIKKGLKRFGFSDHSPYVFEGDYYSTFRMRPDQLGDYVKTVLDLKDEYKNDIELHVGLEAEYYPRFFEGFLRLIEPYPIEYLLLGQHFLHNEMDMKVHSTMTTDDESLLSLLVDQTSEGLQTGKFACVAHPDLMNFTGADDVYEKHMRRLCENARTAGVPLEINLLGIRSHRAYPRERFWKLVGEVGNDVVLGGDAHAACDVVDNASEAIAMGWVEKYHLNWHPATWALNKKRL